MSTEVRPVIPRSADGAFEWDPAWDDAHEFPVRISCAEEKYLAIDDNLLLEYAGGFLEVLPMPTIVHQLIVTYLGWQLDAFVAAGKLGTVVFAAYKVRVSPGKYRDPDTLSVGRENRSAIGKDFCAKADLVMEIVSESNRRHDLVIKRDEYARAGIPEYWIVDPEEETITIFVLKPRRKTYVGHGTFQKSERAASKALPGSGVDVSETFNQKP